MKFERIRQALTEGDYMIINDGDNYVIDVDFITVAKYNPNTGLSFTIDGVKAKMFTDTMIEDLLSSIKLYQQKKKIQ